MIHQNLRAGLAMLLIIAPVAGQPRTAIKHAGQVFEKRCAQCHVIPDPGVRTDRGWLDQVNRTA